MPLESTGEDGEPRELPLPDGTDLEAEFQREWTRSLFGLAVEALRARCAGAGKEVAFTLFERYDLEGADGPTSGPAMRSSPRSRACPSRRSRTTCTGRGASFGAAVLETLREITASEAEFRAEARALLGVEAP